MKKKVIACIIARTVSTRLPLKIFRDIGNGTSLLDFLITRIKSVSAIDEVFLCTSQEDVDDILEDVATKNNIRLYRGSANAVIERMLAAGKMASADIVLRITGDNPFTAIEYIGQQINFLIANQLDYVRITDVPIGATAEVISYSALQRCNELMDPSVSEYMMLFLFEPKHFKCGVLKVFPDDYSYLSLTVDTKRDLARARTLINSFANADAINILLRDCIEVLKKTEPAVDLEHSTTAIKTVKLPYGKEMSFEDFRADMIRRKENAQMLNLIKNE